MEATEYLFRNWQINFSKSVAYIKLNEFGKFGFVFEVFKANEKKKKYTFIGKLCLFPQKKICGQFSCRASFIWVNDLGAKH